MYSKERLKQILKEKEEKRIERQKKKKEKEKEKKRLKSIERHKKSRSKSNKKYYAKIRKQQLAERYALGDENTFFTILLTKNRYKVKRIGAARWKTDAYKIFNEAISKNREEVKFPVEFANTDTNGQRKNIYELVMITSSPDGERITKLKNKEGKYVDNIIRDKSNHIIVDKHEWLIEETFHVYGYHPLRDRKTYDFILNEVLLKNIFDKYDIRTIITYRNKVFIKYIDDFDFILCKDASEAIRLAAKLEKDAPKELKKNIIYLGEINRKFVPQLVNDMIEKTGWTRTMCKRVKL